MEHLTSLKRKLACDNAMLCVARTCLPFACLNTLYHSFSHAHLSYTILFWPSANSTLLHNINVLEKCAICIICSSNPKSHVHNLVNDLKNLFFDDFVLYNCCMFMFDAIHGHLPAVITCFLFYLIHVVCLLDNIMVL